MTTPDLYSIPYGDEGPLVVFCHGLLGQGRNFAQIAKQLGRHGARTILLDMPNHGRSLWTDHFDYPQAADIVAAWLRSAPEVAGEPVTLVGHSMGGKISMLLALRHPELVERLAVLDMSPVAYQHGSEFRHIIDALRGLDLASLADRDEASELLRPALPERGLRLWLLQNLTRDGDAWRWLPNLDVLDSELDRIVGWPEGVRGRWAGPTLWLRGAESNYVLPEYDAVMRGYFPAALKVSVKHAGHWLHTEQREVVTEALRRLLQQPTD